MTDETRKLFNKEKFYQYDKNKGGSVSGYITSTSMTVDDGIVSGFSDSAYINTLGFFNYDLPNLDNWEIQVRFYYAGKASRHQQIITQNGNYLTGLLVPSGTNNLKLEVSTSTSSTNIGSIIIENFLEADKWYEATASYDNVRGYQLEVTDGSSYTYDTLAKTTKVTNTNWFIGRKATSSSTKQYFTGKVDLKNCFVRSSLGSSRYLYLWRGISTNNELPLLTGSTYSQQYNNVYSDINATVVGSPLVDIDKDRIALKFDDRSYLRLDEDVFDFNYFNNRNYLWDFRVHFRYDGQSSAGRQNIATQMKNFGSGIKIEKNTNKLMFTFGNSTSSYNIGTITDTEEMEVGKDYIARIVFNGSYLLCYVSNNLEISWRRIGAVESDHSKGTNLGNDKWTIGTHYTDTTTVFKGTVYLDDYTKLVPYATSSAQVAWHSLKYTKNIAIPLSGKDVAKYKFAKTAKDKLSDKIPLISHSLDYVNGTFVSDNVVDGPAVLAISKDKGNTWSSLTLDSSYYYKPICIAINETKDYCYIPSMVRTSFLYIEDISKANTSTPVRKKTIPYATGDDVYELRGLAYGAGRFVALRFHAFSYVYGISVGTNPDLSDDSYRTIYPLREGLSWNNIVYSHGEFACISPTGVVAHSPDGLNWYYRGFNNTTATITSYGNIYSLNNEFMTHESTNKRIQYTSGGLSSGSVVNFSYYPSNVDYILDITYGNGKYVAIGRTGLLTTYSRYYIIWSSDKTNWKTAQVPSDVLLTDIAYGDGVFIASSSQGYSLRFTLEGDTLYFHENNSVKE